MKIPKNYPIYNRKTTPAKVFHANRKKVTRQKVMKRQIKVKNQPHSFSRKFTSG